MTTADLDAEERDFSDEAATFGDRIVAARDAMGMTSQQLARRMGIKPATLQSWENDRSEPRANKLQMLAGLLNVSMVWLMSGEGRGVRGDVPQEASNVDWQPLIDELRAIREAQSELVLRSRRLERRLLAFGK